MKRDDALKDLTDTFGEYKQRSLSDGSFLVEVGPLPIVGGNQKTKVALKLHEEINSVPEVFVETHVTLNSGGQPANTNNVDIEGQPWKKWSFATEWTIERYSIVQLVYATLSRFNR